ncbi:TetR family transcriptional regulator [Streptomyces sp. JB150]|uniref:TetR family transcriptional regulator n=1 Tax=Streptomyces sp. JB150 TaxID=2714844 RepID=UPI0014072B63|nr:TetR family transcriptional regulator [Streptomyces sp. JB150]QIJ66257.1 TetR family transcriptional regulator [Streptomyces sp. JB150]
MQDVTEESAPPGGLRERKKRATRAALVEAAVRLAAEHGAENVTVEAISEAAGVSPRTFFNYFDSRDDVFVMIGADSRTRIRDAVLAAPANLPPLQALRRAMAAELAEVEQQHELWRLHAEVLRRSPRLLVRSLGVYASDELGLAETLAERLGAGTSAEPNSAPAEPTSAPAGSTASSADDVSRRLALDLYPRLLAAVGVTAVRVAFEHWCVRQEERPFADVFEEAFDHLAAGLRAPTGTSSGTVDGQD